MNKMIARGVAPLLAALILTACATPEFKQPQIATPTAFRESQTPQAAAEVAGIEGSRWKPAQPAEQQRGDGDERQPADAGIREMVMHGRSPSWCPRPPRGARPACAARRRTPG